MSAPISWAVPSGRVLLQDRWLPVQSVRCPECSATFVMRAGLSAGLDGCRLRCDNGHEFLVRVDDQRS